MMVYQLSLLEDYSCHNITSLNGLGVMYSGGAKNVSYECQQELLPAGFDEMSEGEKLGSYYYLFEGETIRIFILKDKTYEQLKKTGSVTIYGKLEEDVTKSKYIEQSYAETVGKGSDVFTGSVQTIMINELKFPYRRILILNIAKKAVPGLIIVTILYMMIALIRPELIFGINRIGIKKSKKKLIKILNKEMEDIEEQEGHVYATEHYVIEAYVSHIDIQKNE